MVSFPKNLVEKQKQALPPHLKEALYSKEIGQKIVDIAKENGIKDREQIVKICSVIGYTILGIINPKEIEKYLTEDLQIKESLAKDIASTLRIQILLDFPELFKRETPRETPQKTPRETPEEERPNQLQKEKEEKITKQEKLELTNQTQKETGKQIEIRSRKDPYLEPPDEDIEPKPVVVREQGRARKVF